jgi:RNA polymerase-binding protein DksA
MASRPPGSVRSFPHSIGDSPDSGRFVSWDHRVMTQPSPEQLRRAKEILSQRHQELTARIERVAADLRRQTEAPLLDAPDRAVQQANEATLQAIQEAAQSELDQIKYALQRMDDGRYGICASCGRPINQARLDHVPYTARCATCASGSGNEGADVDPGRN